MCLALMLAASLFSPSAFRQFNHFEPVQSASTVPCRHDKALCPSSTVNAIGVDEIDEWTRAPGPFGYLEFNVGFDKSGRIPGFGSLPPATPGPVASVPR
jgi:hypothetical protein